MKYILFILMIVSLAACRMLKYVPVETKTEIRERIVEVPVPADSSSIVALLECDSLNRVYIKRLSEKQTSNVTQSIKLKDNMLSVAFKSDPKDVKAIVKDSLVYKEVPYPVPGPTKYVYKMYWWQEMLMYIGILALIALLLIIIINRHG